MEFQIQFTVTAFRETNRVNVPHCSTITLICLQVQIIHILMRIKQVYVHQMARRDLVKLWIATHTHGTAGLTQRKRK